MSASTNVRLPETDAPLISAFLAKLDQLRHLFSEELGCDHNELVFDEINDVSCRHCGKDFTG